MRTNCPNCGGPLKWGNPHCEFCGTRVVDLTMLDFATNEPTAFVLKLPYNKYLPKEYKNSNIYVSILAKPELGLISNTANQTEIRGGWGSPAIVVDTNRSVEIEVTLHSCAPTENNGIMTIWREDRK